VAVVARRPGAAGRGGGRRRAGEQKLMVVETDRVRVRVKNTRPNIGFEMLNGLRDRFLPPSPPLQHR
jgi:hypothetical protein